MGQDAASERGRRRWRLCPVAFIAYRNLAANRRITALLLLAVAAGMGFQVPIEATLDGYHWALMDEGVHRGTGAVRLTPRDGQWIERIGALADEIAGYRGVRAVLPVLTLPGVIRAHGGSLRCAVRGVTVIEGASFYRLASGRDLDPADPNGALVGIEFAEELGIRVGERIGLRVLLDESPGPLPEDAVGRYQLTVRGIVTGAFGGRDAVFLDRGFLAGESGRQDEASEVAVYLGDPEQAVVIKHRIVQGQPDLRVQTWHEYSDYLRSNLAAISAISRVAVLMVVAAVAIPVLSLLTIVGMHKRREVGLLCALGVGRGGVFLAFLLHAAMVAAVGIAVGCALAWGLLAWFSAHPVFEWEGLVIRPLPSVPSFVRPAALVLGTTVLAATLPAALAARTDPARALRGVE